MKKRRMTPRLMEQMRELALNRSLGTGLTWAYLANVGREVHTWHHTVDTTEDDDLLQAVASHFICGLVSCWETFFRDFFIEVVRDRPDLIERLGQETGAEIRGLPDVLAADVISKSFNFQNLHDVERAFSPIFGDRFLSQTATYVFPAVAFGGEAMPDWSLARGVDNWDVFMEYCFEERHRITHDANYVPEHLPGAILRAELVFVLLPQVVLTWFDLEHRKAALPEGGALAFLRPMDLLAEAAAFMTPDGIAGMVLTIPEDDKEEPQG